MREQLRDTAEGQTASLYTSDYNEVMGGAYQVLVDAQLLATLRNPKIGPALGYLLAKHPTEVGEIFRRLAVSSF